MIAMIMQAINDPRQRWMNLARELPVPVTVWHNWTPRHYDGYEQGADHIVLLEPLDVGRIQRAARRPLCETPSRRRQLRNVFANGEAQYERVPDCKACLRLAEGLAQGWRAA